MLRIEGCMHIQIEEHRVVIQIQDGDPNHPTSLKVTIPPDWKEFSGGFVGGKDGDGIPILISHGGLNGTTFEIHDYSVPHDKDERYQW